MFVGFKVFWVNFKEFIVVIFVVFYCVVVLVYIVINGFIFVDVWGNKWVIRNMFSKKLDCENYWVFCLRKCCVEMNLKLVSNIVICLLIM